MKMEGDDLDDCDVVRPKPVQSSSPVLRNLDDGLGLTFADEISSTEVNGVCYNDAGSCENALLESDISAKDIVEDDNFDGGSDKCSYLCDDDEFLRAERFNVDAFMEDFVLDSIAVQFHADVFLVQFVCHVFFPLAYVLINYKGQGFEITRDVLVQPRFYINIVTCLFVYAMVISYFMCPVEDQKPISGALWVPLIFFIQHRMTIGLKYASLSPTEYEKFQKTTDVNQAYRYLTQMQLLNGWATRSSLLLQFELGCAAARLGAKINEISISIADPSTRATARNDFANWNALLQHRSTVSLSARPAPELVRHDDGSYTLSVYDLCRAVIMKADVSSTQRMKFLIYIFMVLINAVPWANILADPDKFPHRSVYLYVFLGTNVLIMGLFGTVAFLILYVSVWDVSRQLHMVSYLHRLIRITDLTLDSDFTFRKGRDDVRAREHIREKIDVILSVTKPERSKSIAIRKSLSAKPTVSFSSSRDPSPRSDSSTRVYNSLGANIAKMELNERSKADVRPDSEFLLGENSARISARNASVSSRELKLRFAEFGVKSMKEGDGSHIPQISFKSSENIIGWTYARLVVQNFGERFRYRVDTYTGGTMLLMVALMGAELLMVVIDPRPLDSYNTVFFQQSLLAVILMWLFLLVCLSLGALVNNQLNLHSRTFAAHKLRLRDEMLILSALPEQEEHAPELAKLAESLEELEACKDVIETYAELKPFSVFGFKVEGSMVFTIFSTGVSFFGVLFSLYANAANGNT